MSITRAALVKWLGESPLLAASAAELASYRIDIIFLFIIVIKHIKINILKCY